MGNGFNFIKCSEDPKINKLCICTHKFHNHFLISFFFKEIIHVFKKYLNMYCIPCTMLVDMNTRMSNFLPLRY